MPPRTRQAHQPLPANPEGESLYRLDAGAFKHRGAVIRVSVDGDRTVDAPKAGGTALAEPGCLVRLRQLDVETLARHGLTFTLVEP